MDAENLIQRIDIWLWYARFFKTRSLATKMVRGGKVRVNGNICKKSSHSIHIGDVLTFTRAEQILIIKIIDVGERRGPAPEAQLLYEDLTPLKVETSKLQREFSVKRDKGKGRPTKVDRRAIDKLMDR
jgi:ribosome-associated heat shock protein Hsp15